MLRNVLCQRWPGFLIPACPAKKFLGNKNKMFVGTRCLFLDRFLRNVAQNPYLFNSDEFRTFLLPPSGDVEKSLSMLPKLSTDQILERLKTVGRLNEVHNCFVRLPQRARARVCAGPRGGGDEAPERVS